MAEGAVPLRPTRWTRAALSILVLAVALGTSGCMTVGPDFSPPRSPVEATAWPALAASDAAAPPGGPVALRWWTVFGDPVLGPLVERAAAQNLDLRQAMLRIEAARAQARSAGAAARPGVDADGVAGRARMSDNGPLGGGGGASMPSTFNLFQLGFDALWELDLWGRVRRQVEAAQADTEAAQAGRAAAVVSLCGEVARTVVALRAAHRRAALAEADLASQERLTALVASRVEVGLSAQAEQLAQEAERDAARARLPQARQQVLQARNRLAWLLALPPRGLDAELAASPPPTAALPPSVPIGLPGELLRRRPDIRQAEAEVHASTARIGVATAALFPTVRLGAFGGFQASHAGDLTDWGSRFLLGGTQVSIPLAHGGQLQAQVELADMAQREALLRYRGTVLRAFHEVDDALVGYSEEQTRGRSLAAAAQRADAARTLAEDRWRNGLGSYLEVLQAQRRLYEAQSQFDDSLASAQSALVGLYKALGGGWEVLAPEQVSAIRAPASR